MFYGEQPEQEIRTECISEVIKPQSIKYVSRIRYRWQIFNASSPAGNPHFVTLTYFNRSDVIVGHNNEGWEQTSHGEQHESVDAVLHPIPSHYGVRQL